MGELRATLECRAVLANDDLIGLIRRKIVEVV